ncbi:hypothetical protein [Bacillus sp. NPDC094106]|uniref:hypothetical protein n=1 Tax=Bacillus sp. NPDC094106 TaxID=3363949 RepID=UPI00381CCE58
MKRLTNEQLSYMAKAFKELDSLIDSLESENPDRTDCGDIQKAWVLIHDRLTEQVGEDFCVDKLIIHEEE